MSDQLKEPIKPLLRAAFFVTGFQEFIYAYNTRFTERLAS
ncbi:MAG: hypothetical protein ACI9HK_004614, partial [Pirellulaceae bacterium]